LKEEGKLSNQYLLQLHIKQLDSKVEITIFLWNHDSEIILKPRSSILNIIPVVCVAFRISVMSNLEFIEASKEFCFVYKEDSVLLSSPWIHSVWNLSNLISSPGITDPETTTARAAMISSNKVIIVIVST
jgi:hypothetical protein